MTRRRLLILLASTLAFAAGERGFAPALAKDGDGGGGGGGRGSDGGSGGGEGGRGRGGDDGSRGRGGDEGSRGRGGERGDDRRGRGGDDAPAWGRTSSDRAREAVDRGWALSLDSVLPTVAGAVPGSVLDVDLRESASGEWRYEFLVLTRDRHYREVTVDARRNQVLQVRRRQ